MYISIVWNSSKLEIDIFVHSASSCQLFKEKINIFTNVPYIYFHGGFNLSLLVELKRVNLSPHKHLNPPIEDGKLNSRFCWNRICDGDKNLWFRNRFSFRWLRLHYMVVIDFHMQQELKQCAHSFSCIGFSPVNSIWKTKKKTRYNFSTSGCPGCEKFMHIWKFLYKYCAPDAA
jgi:hypothetical protein